MALVFPPALGGADVGIIMARSVPVRFAAVAMIAAAIIASTTASGWAFTQQMLSTGENGNYNFNYSDPAHSSAGSQSMSPSDPNSPGFHFNIEQSQTGPFSGFQSGNHFGNGSNATAPDYYSRPLGNGN
jgi:hypothetical protein